jgi:hypothetical protein
VHKASGYNLQQVLDDFAHQALDLVSTPAKLSELENKVSQSLRCGYHTSVQCLNNPGRLPSEIAIYAVQAVALITGLRIIKCGALATVLSPLLFLIAWPVIAKRTYGLEYGCSISTSPVVPVCTLSDVQNMVYMLTPEHFPWPSPLVQRNGSQLTVFDCTTLGFGNGVYELRYFADTYAPGWLPAARVGANVVGTSVLDSVRATGGNSSAIETQCAGLYAFTAVPVALILLFVLLSALVLIHIALVAFGYLANAAGSVARGVVAGYLDISQRM